VRAPPPDALSPRGRRRYRDSICPWASPYRKWTAARLKIHPHPEESMRVLVVGGTGTIGRAVVQALSARHEVVSGARHTGDVQAGLTLPDSVQRLLERVGEFDALISAAGAAAWKPLAELTEEDFR